MSYKNLFSAQLKIDEEAEHYCRVHSPKRRRKVVQDKVKTGMEKLNTLKMIEKDVEDGVVKERGGGDGDGGEDGLVGGEERARMEGRVVELRAVERNGERRRDAEVNIGIVLFFT